MRLSHGVKLVSNNLTTLEQGRKNLAKAGLDERITLELVGDHEYLGFRYPDAHFDVVTFYDCVCHLPDKAGFFRELYRIVKPGGRIGGVDWLQRPFGEIQTDVQIEDIMRGVNEGFVIPWHGTVDGYRKSIRSRRGGVEHAWNL